MAGLAATVEYRREMTLGLDEATDVYRDSALGARRPIDDPEVLTGMLNNANLIITARTGGRLIGVSRTLTDFTYVGYLADLAVVVEHQRAGIGKRLIDETRRHMGPRASLVLLAAPAAVDYYRHIGFHKVESAWMLSATDPLAE